MTVSSTSRNALRDLEASGRAANQRGRIMAVVRGSAKALTRREIAQRAGLEASAVAGRVNDMIALGMLADGDQRRCSVSGRTAKEVVLCMP